MIIQETNPEIPLLQPETGHKTPKPVNKLA
jgi:hypothetical protein